LRKGQNQVTGPPARRKSENADLKGSFIRARAPGQGCFSRIETPMKLNHKHEAEKGIEDAWKRGNAGKKKAIIQKGGWVRISGSHGVGVEGSGLRRRSFMLPRAATHKPQTFCQ